MAKKEEPVVEPVAVTETEIVNVAIETFGEAFLSPSPVDRGQMYVESHPTLGITKTAHVVKQSIGDGRPGDGAEIVRS